MTSHFEARLIAFLFFLLLSFVFETKECPGQSIRDDLEQIKSKSNEVSFKYQNYIYDQYNNKMPIRNTHRFILYRIEPVFLLARYSMLFYQHIVSPQFSAHCVYQRSCSNFCKKAIEEYGLIKGVFLSADRLLRCNSLSASEANEYDKNGYVIDELYLYRTK
jgi:putative component of membrane protein insertase Oxa1/YidC/SpoIIIJ protein YidD